jgi:hypothetical protein
MKTLSGRAPLHTLPLSRAACLGLALAGLAGCSSTEQAEPATTSRTGLDLIVGLDAQSDVTAMRFTLQRVSCAGEPIEAFSVSVDKPLEDIRLPGGIPGFEDAPFDGDSEHVFADMFLDVAPGCYRATTQPLAAGGANSVACAAATANSIQVNAGETTELLLINQCQGEGRGAVDIISGLNHPPALLSLAFTRSKFVVQCRVQEVCATVKDPENDPVEFVWTQVSGPPLRAQPWVARTEPQADGSVTQCVGMVPETPGEYGMKVTAYDLLHNPAGGGLMRIEDYLAQEGNPLPSRTELSFPFYTADDGTPGGCNPTSCFEQKQRAPNSTSGVYTVDPDGVGPIAPFEAYCDMERDGGGWTLVMVSSDDGQATWTWNQRTLMTTDQTLVGNVHERNKDFKSRALHTLPFRDLLFVHAPSSVWAAYGGVSNGSSDVASFMAAISAPVCDLNLAGNGYPQSAGTLMVGGKLCDTDLYFHLGDFDGFGSENYCRGVGDSQDSTYGPGWSVGNNGGCPFDDPGNASFGPDIYPEGASNEYGGSGFGWALDLNTGAPGAAANYIQMYVR